MHKWHELCNRMSFISDVPVAGVVFYNFCESHSIEPYLSLCIFLNSYLEQAINACRLYHSGNKYRPIANEKRNPSIILFYTFRDSPDDAHSLLYQLFIYSMYVKVNADAIHQDTPCRWSCLAGPWYGRIQQRIVLYWMLVHCLSMLSTGVMAQATPSKNENTTDTNGGGVTAPLELPDITDGNGSPLEAVRDAIMPQTVIAAINSLLVGFQLGLLGYSSQKTFFVAGFALAAILAYIACINIAPFDGGEGDDLKKIIYVVVSAVAGFLFGFSSIHWESVGMIMVGLLGGFIGALFILALALNDIAFDTIGRIVSFAILMIAFAALIYKFKKPMAIIITAIAGSFVMVLGIDFFVKAEFINTVVSIVSSSPDIVYSFDAETFAMLGLLGGLAIIFLFVQFFHYRRERNPNSNANNNNDNNVEAATINNSFQSNA
jgi:hypothetical protein